MKRLTVPITVLVAAAALVGLLIYGLTTTGDDTTLDVQVRKGAHPVAPGPTRELPVLGSSAKQSLADYRGKVVVLNFWASWCGPCRQEAPVLERAQAQLRSGGAGTVLGATYQDASSDALDFVKDVGMSYPSLRDSDVRLAKDYGTNKLPETFVINRQGRVVALSRGTIDDKFIQDALRKAGA